MLADTAPLLLGTLCLHIWMPESIALVSVCDVVNASILVPTMCGKSFCSSGGEGAVFFGFLNTVLGFLENFSVFLAFHRGMVIPSIDLGHARVGENHDGNRGSTRAVGIFNEIGKPGRFGGVDNDAFGKGKIKT